MAYRVISYFFEGHGTSSRSHSHADRSTMGPAERSDERVLRDEELKKVKGTEV